MCKIKLILAVSLFFSINVYSQNQYRLGDKLKTQQISCSKLQEIKGVVPIWSMGTISLLKKYDKQYFTNIDTTIKANMVQLDNETSYFYEQDDRSLKICGFQNHTTDVSFDISETYIMYPITIDSHYSGIFNGSGFYASNEFLRLFGTYDTKVDGFGTLITCDNDTLIDTYKIHTRRILCSQYYNRDSILNVYNKIESIPSLSKSDILHYVASDNSNIVTDIYRWYSPGYRYPILETVSNKNPNGKVLFETAFYNAPSDQLSLSKDVENDKIREITSKKTYNSSINNYKESNQKDVNLNVNVATNGRNNTIFVNYILDSNSHVYYAIYTESGIELYLNDKNTLDAGFHSDRVNLNNLKGVYLFVINIDGRTLSRKFFVK